MSEVYEEFLRTWGNLDPYLMYKKSPPETKIFFSRQELCCLLSIDGFSTWSPVQSALLLVSECVKGCKIATGGVFVVFVSLASARASC